MYPIPMNMQQQPQQLNRVNYPKEALNKVPKKERNRKKREKKKGNLELSNPRSVSTAPVAIAYKNRNFQGSGRNMNLKNSEMIATISGTTGFAAVSFSVNPGLSATFPWLAGIATSFQQYRFKSLRFEFVPSVSTSEPGLVTISPEYNVRDSTPSSLQEASNTEDATQGNTWVKNSCHLKPERMFYLGRRKDIRSTAVSGDLNIYDAAKLNIITGGQVTLGAIGHLWVHYDVELAVPQSSPGAELLPSSTSFYYNNVLQNVPNSVETEVQLDLKYDPLNFGQQDAFAVFTPPAGSYWLTGQVQLNHSTTAEITHYVQVFVNNVGLFPNSSFLGPGASPDGSDVSIPFNTILNCNGTDKVFIGVFSVYSTGSVFVPSKTACLAVCLA